MASKLIRLSRNTLKLNIRQISMVSTTKWIKKNSETVLLQPTLISSLNKLSLFKNNYASSSSDRPTRSQLEQKVLDLLRQFDRIKENPSKPDVIN
jgi:hypothetical protein